MNDRILFVDDEKLLLDGIRRRLGHRFNLQTAEGPEEGLRMLASRDPYAVIVADMNMPGMDGATFLALAREASPESVPMMLTGNADLDTSVRAVNQGHVFRFIQKPCPSNELATFLEAGLRQHHLVMADRRAAVLEEANRAKTNFLATVSHELRTPLAKVQSGTELLLHYGDEEPAAVRKEFLESILSASTRLSRIVDQLLMMVQLDAGLIQPKREHFDLRGLLVALIEVTNREGQSTVLDESPHHEPAPVRGDRNLLRQVFQELLGNAQGFAPEGEPIRVSLCSNGKDWQVIVADRGPGIEEHLLEDIFEPFVQRDEVLVDKPAGLGLGLAITKAILALHDGTIECINDSSGRGATMLVKLPDSSMSPTEASHA